MKNNLTSLDYENSNKVFCSQDFVDWFGIYRVNDKDGAAIVCRQRRTGMDFSGRVYPHRDLKTGKIIENCLRLDNPEMEMKSDGTEKPKNKYLFPPGNNIIFSLPIALEQYLTDTSLPIVITEGKNQLISLSRIATNNTINFESLRFLPIAINGVWGWRGTVGKKTEKGKQVKIKGVIPQFEAIVWQKRKIYLAPDADIQTNKNVEGAIFALAKELKSRGAIVHIVKFPLIANYKGVDDLLGVWEREKGTDEAVKVGLQWIESGELFVEPKKENQATRILNFANSLELFHTPDGEAFATIETPNGHFENHSLRLKTFRSWLAYKFFQEEGQMPSTQALQDALNTLEGKAIFEGEKVEMFVRLAPLNGNIYLDLCNESWQIVEISKTGWRVIESKNAPVKFYRTKAMLSLPFPIKGGDALGLKKFLNVADDTFVLIISWLVNCFRPGLSFPVLIIGGEQGSAKSTTSRMLRRLVDPNKTDFRSAPRDERDLIIAATNAWVCAYDNLSSVQPWLSDALCRISTGGGFSTRTLFENTEETVFAAKRPILLNGIGNIADKGDLLDRSVLTSLKPISKNRRKTESEFWSEFEKEEAPIFSGLLDTVVAGLNNIENTRLDHYPRMADFAQFATSVEEYLGFETGAFMKAFESNANNANYTVLEGSAFAETIQIYARENKEFNGNLKQFLEELKPFAVEEIQKSKDYPKSPRGVRAKLERVNPNLRAIGIHIEFLEKTENGQQISLRFLEQECDKPSESSETSESMRINELKPDGCNDVWVMEKQTVIESSASAPKANQFIHNGLINPPDGSDGSHGLDHTNSIGFLCQNCSLPLIQFKGEWFCQMGCKNTKTQSVGSG